MTELGIPADVSTIFQTAPLPNIVVQHAAPAIATVDSAQRFVRLVPGGNGIIYAIQADGALIWYNHTGWSNGAPTWANGGVAVVIGSAWQQFTTVLANSDGQFFALRANGDLCWYRYVCTNLSTGAGSWAANSGSVIGRGFNALPRIFGGSGGVIYGVADDGSLKWYKYLAGNGTNGVGAWANNGVASVINTGMKVYPSLWADDNGVILGAKEGGDLYWWRYLAGDGTNGTGAWANGNVPVKIGSGWGDGLQKEILSNGGGTVYTVAVDNATIPANDDTLVWYRLNNPTTVTPTTISWVSNGVPATIGTGFSLERTAALQGYTDKAGVAPGGTISVQVSSTFATYTASVVQLSPLSGAPVTVWGPSTETGRLQTLPTGYRSAGCGWATDFTVPILATWPTGVYAVRLEGPSGLRRHTAFVVRPTTPVAKIALLLPTFTYQAYNCWAGHDQYSNGQDGGQRTFTMLRPCLSHDVDSTATVSHTLFSDLFLLRWLSTNSIPVDCYSDGDLHASGTWLSSYKAVVLGSHPEYWSATMRQNLVTYLAAGGRVIYTGGNGMYERVQVNPAGTALTFRTTTGARDLFQNMVPSQDPTKVLGVDINIDAYMDFYPYKVLTAHPLLNGTSLNVGDMFGTTAYNGGAASGWEVDVLPDGGLPNATHIAKGQNPAGGADMTYLDNGNGGWVFSAGSLAFNSALPTDTNVSTILHNVFTQALL